MKVSIRKEQLEAQLAAINQELKALKMSAEYKKELSVTRDLENLMKKHSSSADYLVSLLKKIEKPQASRRPRRKTRVCKIYRNPETGETVETRGGNHATLKAWKLQYGLTRIDDWLVDTRP